MSGSSSFSYAGIQVETVGYYHAHSNLTATPDLLPPKLNANKRFFEDPDLPAPFIDLKQEVPEIMEFRETHLASVLDFIRQKGWPDGNKPDFVTDRYLLKSVVAPESATVIHVVRIDGVIYLHSLDEEPVGNSGYRWVFKHILTRGSVDDEIDGKPVIQKAMFKAIVPGEDGENYSVIYSGKVDAVDDDNNHYEIKVSSSGTEPYVWENSSFRLFWQALFGDVKNFIIGARTGKFKGDPKTRFPLRYPPFSIYKIEKIGQKEFFKKASAYAKKDPSKNRQIEDGKQGLQNLLALAKKTLENDGDRFVFSRTGASSEWEIKKDDEAVAEFRGLILKNIPE